MIQSRTVKVLALSTGQSLTVVAGLVATAVLARVLTIHDYATYRQTFLAYHFVAPLLTLSLPTALYYFLPGEMKRRRGVLFDNLTALAIMGLAFAIFLLSGGNRLLAWRFQNPDLVEPLRWMALYAVFALPAGAVGACLMVQNRVVQLTIFNVVGRAISLASMIAATIIWRTPYAPIKALVACEAVLLMVALFIMIRAIPPDDPRLSVASMVAMVKYAVPLGLASVLGTLTLQLDKMIVASICSPAEFAVYANGAFEIPLIGIITGSIATVILVDMRTAISRDDHAEALRLFRLAAVKAACVLLPAMCFLLVFAKAVVILMFSRKYAGSTLPFRFYLFILPVRIVFYGSALMALGQTRIVLVRSIFELAVNAVLSVFLVLQLGAIGAAFATVLTMYLWSLPFNLVYVARGFKVGVRETLPFRQIAKVLLAAVVAALASWIVQECDFIRYGLRLVIAFPVYVVVYIAAGWLFKTEIQWIVRAAGRRFPRCVAVLMGFRKAVLGAAERSNR